MFWYKKLSSNQGKIKVQNIQTHVSCIREVLRTNNRTFLGHLFHGEIGLTIICVLILTKVVTSLSKFFYNKAEKATFTLTTLRWLHCFTSLTKKIKHKLTTLIMLFCKTTHRNTFVTDYTDQANFQDYVKNSLINEYSDYGDFFNYVESSFMTR